MGSEAGRPAEAKVKVGQGQQVGDGRTGATEAKAKVEATVKERCSVVGCSGWHESQGGGALRKTCAKCCRPGCKDNPDCKRKRDDRDRSGQ